MDKNTLDTIKCRVCLGEYGSNSMHELFTNDEKNVDSTDETNQHLNHKIEYCCGIRIRRLSQLPTKVCNRCCDFVRMWYNFRKMCLNSQVYLESTHTLEGRPRELIDASDSVYMEYLFETLQLQKHNQNDYNEEEPSASIVEIDSDFVVDYDEEEDDNGFVPDTEPQDSHKQMLPESITVVEEEYEAVGDNIVVDQSLIYADASQPVDDVDESCMPVKIEHCDIDFIDDEYEDFLSPTPSPDPKPSTTASKRKPGRPRKPDNELRAKRKAKSEQQGKAEEHVEDEPTKFMCNLCGNVYPKKAAFTAHMTAHTDYKPHQCEICHKTFRQMGELRAHIRRHTGERPYKCAYCERHFYDRSEKVRHERVHTNTRPYECKECGKTFTHTAILKNHSLVHSGEKNFSCSICSKSFTLLHQLKAHLQTLTHKSKEEQAFASGNTNSYMLHQ